MRMRVFGCTLPLGGRDIAISEQFPEEIVKIRKKLQSLSEVVGTHVVLDCKWIITVFYTQYRSPPPPPTPINVAPTKTHQT